jgi:hypothetical protein
MSVSRTAANLVGVAAGHQRRTVENWTRTQQHQQRRRDEQLRQLNVSGCQNLVGVVPAPHSEELTRASAA